ncbi:class I adenylate-forming enzyme family protein [Mycolicibacterium sp.]|uniref:class I adenylate-forming enzyme family protein n=1 Tax=Mycolicibacterium sp. TaxID=2320850 RepID=UPI003D0E07A6
MTSTGESVRTRAQAAFTDDELDTFGGLLRRLAARYGPRPAIWHDGAEVTFAEVDAEVDRWAKALLAAGVRHGDTVAVLAGNCPRWMYAVFAVARIGGTCVPVNTWYKADEIRFVLDHTEATVLLSVDSLLKQDFAGYLGAIAPELAASGGDGRLTCAALPRLRLVVALDADSRIGGALPLQDFLAAGADVGADVLAAAEKTTRPDDLLFLLYTSGSTADPKGVQLHHRPALLNDRDFGDRMGLTEHDRMAIFLPLFYSAVAVNVMPAAWTHCCCILLVDAFEAGPALELLDTGGATAYIGFGNHSRALLSHPDFASFDLSKVERGMTGFSAEDRRLAREDLGFSQIITCLGLTECYGPVTATEFTDPDDVTLHTLGRMLPGWEAKVIDPGTGDPVPPGGSGELLLRGYLTSGYYKNPAATAATISEDGFYHTGDLVHFDEAGRLVYHTRIKEVIKSAGQLIVPPEVEAAMMAHPHVRQAFVFGIPDAERGELLAAFVEVDDDTTAEALRDYLRERIAGFKVPARIYVVPDAEIPRVASGKVPKHLLRAKAAQIDAVRRA